MRETEPSKYSVRAANKFTASMCSHKDAAVSQRENKVEMPAMLGMNCGLNPPAAEKK
jgi:hypothetical protein